MVFQARSVVSYLHRVVFVRAAAQDALYRAARTIRQGRRKIKSGRIGDWSECVYGDLLACGVAASNAVAFGDGGLSWRIGSGRLPVSAIPKPCGPEAAIPGLRANTTHATGVQVASGRENGCMPAAMAA